MARPYATVKHVESMSLLPAKLTPGRIYFIDDEQVIVIDHGNGYPPVIYGGKPGPQGASGEPQPYLQHEIDTLAQTELAMQRFMWDESQRVRKEINRLEESFSNTFAMLQELSDQNASAILSLTNTIKRTFDNYDAAISTLAKAVSNLYPDGTVPPEDDEGEGSDDEERPPSEPLLAQSLNVGDSISLNGEKLNVTNYNINPDGSISMSVETQGGFSAKDDPLDDETINTSSGSWQIQQTNYSDGSTVLDLTATPSKVQTLKAGDTFSVGDNTYTVSDYTQNSDGSISLSIH